MPRFPGKSGGRQGSKKGSAQPSHHTAIPYKRKRDRFLPNFKTHSRSTSPSTPSSAPQQVAPPTTNAPGQDLWTKAYQKLPDDLKQQLIINNCAATDKLQTLQDLLVTAVQAKDTSMAKRLTLKLGDKVINVHEIAGRLVDWITKFKEIGDIAVQYDPAHAALPWAGVRFILLVSSTLFLL